MVDEFYVDETLKYPSFIPQTGFEIDGIASIEYLLSRPDIDHGKLVLYGRSLGGAVAFNVSFLDQYTDFLFAVIVENTFTSIPEISKYLFKYLKGLPEWCYKNKVIYFLEISICLYIFCLVFHASVS